MAPRLRNLLKIQNDIPILPRSGNYLEDMYDDELEAQEHLENEIDRAENYLEDR